ncbi:TrmB family transcriptional regulator [Halorubrum rubrum]|uniref:TrmB family transcriptional regulator n=1 Tax=Halorubrum rubrum TaxID=1126240 RepID=A0ABD5QZJ9_9EURY|nr:TrmB family transcriptional regulator [Halorubrum rubrum]
MRLEEVRGVLEDAELSPYQAKTFLALLKLGDASVSEIVENCVVPQPRIYDVLRSLDEKGFIETYEEDSLRARVVDPDTLVDELETKSERYAAAAEKIDSVWEQPPIGEHHIEIFNDFKQVVRNAIDGIQRANDSVTIAANGSEFLQLKSALMAAKQNGIVVQLSIHLEQSSNTDIDDLEPYLKDAASEVRYRHSSSPFLTLVDANRSYFGVPRRGRGYGMFVQDQALSSMLFRYFQDSLWGRWDVVYSDRSETFPKKFTDIRSCLTELIPHLESGERLIATINGYETGTGSETTIEGQIIDVVPDPDSDSSIYESREVTIVVETEDGTYDVGGFGAVVEDIRATLITIEDSA